MSTDVSVPYGLDENDRLVPPDQADRSTNYRCPGCRAPLVFKAGPINRAHFAHDANAACSPESLLHQSAKHMVAQVVKDWKAGVGEPPKVHRPCGTCGTPIVQVLPARIDDASIEHPIGGRWRADVALLSGEQVIAIVEVVVTHKVDAEKAANLKVPCAELDANEVLASPLDWRPLSTTARKVNCPPCDRKAAAEKAAEAARDEQLREIGRLSNQPVQGTPYLTRTTTCWSCKRATLVSSWDGHTPWPQNEPPSPRPRTVLYLYSKTIKRHYWANSCGHCGKLQGDNFLYDEPTGPFYTPGVAAHAAEHRPIRGGLAQEVMRSVFRDIQRR